MARARSGHGELLSPRVISFPRCDRSGGRRAPAGSFGQRPSRHHGGPRVEGPFVGGTNASDLAGADGQGYPHSGAAMPAPPSGDSGPETWFAKPCSCLPILRPLPRELGRSRAAELIDRLRAADVTHIYDPASRALIRHYAEPEGAI
jgi:hypothetical protein